MATPAPAASLKALYTAGEVRKKDVFSVPLDKLEFEPGFNLREEGEELEAHIESMAQFILAGGTMPPLEVRVLEGRVLVVEGHCRTRAYRIANERGASIADVACLPFTGNDAARVVKMIASSQGKELTPLERAKGYARLRAFDKDPQEIAGSVGKTRQHVEQLLILADANSDVHALVKSGAVAAAVAIEAVRKHGEKAGEFLSGHLSKAQAAGKTKVTGSAVKAWVPPRAVVADLVGGVDEFMGTLSKLDRDKLGKIARGECDSHEVVIEGAVLVKLFEAHGGVLAARAKQEKKSAAADVE